MDWITMDKTRVIAAGGGVAAVAGNESTPPRTPSDNVAEFRATMSSTARRVVRMPLASFASCCPRAADIIDTRKSPVQSSCRRSILPLVAPNTAQSKYILRHARTGDDSNDGKRGTMTHGMQADIGR